MGKSNETGARGERIAEEYLLNKGLTILHRNWRTAHKEVDLIAVDGDMLVFFEIKTRSSFRLGFPEESVSATKQSHIYTAAREFLNQYPHYRTVRFDIVSIVMRNGIIEDIRHFVDAF